MGEEDEETDKRSWDKSASCFLAKHRQPMSMPVLDIHFIDRFFLDSSSYILGLSILVGNGLTNNNMSDLP